MYLNVFLNENESTPKKKITKVSGGEDNTKDKLTEMGRELQNATASLYKRGILIAKGT